MNIILIRFCIILSLPFLSIAQCDHTVILSEDFGDGWGNGAAQLEVSVNGTPVLTGLTILNGMNTASFTFQADLNDIITAYLTVNNDQWFNIDNSQIIILDNNMTQIASGAPPLTPSAITATGGVCIQPCPHTVLLTEDFGDGWGSGAALMEIAVNGVPVISNLTINNGTTASFQFPANTGDNITAYLTQNNDQWFNIDNSAIEIFDSEMNSMGTGVPPMSPASISFSGGLCPNTTPLPVEMSFFDANCESIMWSTVSETNASHFIIEESSDGINWTIVADYVKAVGNSTIQQDYTINHSSKHNMTYYQINQYDMNGKHEKLGMISVDCNKSNSNKVPINYFNLMGQEVRLDELSQGAYIIVYSDGTTERVFK